MAEYPPFMNAYGNITKILKKIKEAKAPDRFTQDFLGTSLGFTGGSSTPFIPFAKRIGLLSSDGVPTDLYHRFRNESESGRAIAEAMQHGYPTIFSRNEYANKLDKAKLTGLLMEITGLEPKSKTLAAIVESFLVLKSFADFDAESPLRQPTSKDQTLSDSRPSDVPPGTAGATASDGLRFSYTIYLNLPNTDNIAVFNAIFKSLKENLPFG